MNSMCDMTQFVMCVVTKTVTASHLAMLFMGNVLLKFCLCALIVVNVDSKLKDTFIQMAESLNIRVHIAASRNHMTVSIERFHKFLNHSTTILA